MSTDMKKQINWFKLCGINGLGVSKITKIISLFSDWEKIFSLSKEELLSINIFTPKMVEELLNVKEENFLYLQNLIEEWTRQHIEIIPYYSKSYPEKLKRIREAPLILFAKGNLNLLDNKKVAIVGSRVSSELSKKWIHSVSSELSKKQITIVSGGAIGADFAAHKGSLDVGGKTICVLGSGILKPYPEENNSLFEEIDSKKGLFLSEILPNARGDRLSLLRRNRIISGLSDAIILSSSSSKGGSMAQLKIAYKQRIPIFCPALDLKIIPNEGIKIAFEKYSAIEIVGPELILKKLKGDFLSLYP